MIGKTLAHYEITSQLGKGGMGEVYQAKDTKLGRDVAIKVLPEEYARAVDRVARFQREAKLLASLNHPNIAAIYGLEESGSTKFIVLELVEGETLADRLKRGPIPVEESFNLALQIAEALEAAHDNGVIHRDLKPANIKITPEGKVKVLDFGLAKAYTSGEASSDLSNSPTMSDIATRQGVILGTSAYMSPEQATGKSVDKRADIWAFGVVLFEMLTGKKLFEGDTVTETLAGVIKGEPDWNALPRELHSRIRLMLERCLKKVPKNRYSGISDARVDMQDVLADPNGIFIVHSSDEKIPAWNKRIVLWLVTTIFVSIVMLTLVIQYMRQKSLSASRNVIRFEHSLQRNQAFSSQSLMDLAVSPDGKQFVFATSEGLYLRSMEELNPRQITAPNEIGAEPFFSYDGKWVGYISANEGLLKKVPTFGGPAVVICKVGTVFDGYWGSDDTIIFAELGKGIMKVPAGGGTPELLIAEKNGPIYHPRSLPGSKSVIYTFIDDGLKVAVHRIDSDIPKTSFQGESAFYVSTGHLVYTIDNSFFAVPFDTKKLEITGPHFPIELGEDISQGGGGSPQIAVSESGTLVYIPQSAMEVEKVPVWVDRNGVEEPVSTDTRLFSGIRISTNGIRISPDSNQVALTVASGKNRSIWIWDLPRKNLRQLTDSKSLDIYPHWTPDMKWILFSSLRTGNFDIYRIPTDGSGGDSLVFSEPNNATFIRSISTDGSFAICASGGVSNVDIAELSLRNDGSLQPVLNAAYHEDSGRISPDGQYLAYVAIESGREEVYIRPYPEVNRNKWTISSGGGSDPLWSPNGKELFYRSGDAVMAVFLGTETSLDPGIPRILFKNKYLSNDTMSWDIHPNGKRFLMLKMYIGDSDQEIENRLKINVIVNWLEELKGQVPVE